MYEPTRLHIFDKTRVVEATTLRPEHQNWVCLQSDRTGLIIISRSQRYPLTICAWQAQESTKWQDLRRSRKYSTKDLIGNLKLWLSGGQVVWKPISLSGRKKSSDSGSFWKIKFCSIVYLLRPHPRSTPNRHCIYHCVWSVKKTQWNGCYGKCVFCIDTVALCPPNLMHF